MPYIHPEDRALLEEDKLKEIGATCVVGGDLNFCVTTLVLGFLGRDKLSYAAINEAMGALECAKLELYRRMAGPYEDTKIAQNGDVYPNN